LRRQDIPHLEINNPAIATKVKIMEITLQVPEDLGQELQRHQNQLVEILMRGLRDITATEGITYQDENSILELLANQPTPQQVLAIRPSPELQTRVSELLRRSKESSLSSIEETELSRYFTLEHLVRLAKAHAARKLTNPSQS
jgi:hypothetical protein